MFDFGLDVCVLKGKIRIIGKVWMRFEDYMVVVY